MQSIKQYIVDAFTDKVFSGNPAAICILDKWLSEATMQKIAIENNLSESAFAVKKKDHYHLRWFTPGGEVELCGHATLATAYVIMQFIEPNIKQIDFQTLSGSLTVKKENDLFVMNFPSFSLEPVAITDKLIQALGVKPAKAYMGADMVCVLENETLVKNVIPNLAVIRTLKGVCLHVTAKGIDYDCVTRTFAPKCNVAEDPVCGRAHCHVISLWAQALNKNELTAYQASSRGGVLYCHYAGSRTILKGKAVLFSEAQIYFEEENS